ncbi:hypothetical protein BCON_0362g00080 [Botryotinia convoluta]|uniref:Heterokaryon incompatibility domain-containing protein n=1 Tax=Botryotinia convoluta TaxID=54673 RepID=A0A4Z1HC30_9HELO|nr:hypothetical protein BCON_0362g00080 [Botryotinia convoluta]
MRLLQRKPDGEIVFREPTSGNVPAYAILSHTWGEEEVAYQDLENGEDKNKIVNKAGWRKIQFCVKQAVVDGLEYIWVDICCIDKRNAVELGVAINSMFRWYQNAARCYIYLSDVSKPDTGVDNQKVLGEAFKKSRWFTRGWTLQELIALRLVEFFSLEDKALRGDALSNFSIKERRSWAKHCNTTIEEDEAYCLIGIFDVSIVLNYSERRDQAFRRLEDEIYRMYKGVDFEQFAIRFNLALFPEAIQFVAREKELSEMYKLLQDYDSRSCVTLYGLGGMGKTQQGTRIHIQKLLDIREDLGIVFNMSERKDIEKYPDVIALVEELDSLLLAPSTAGIYLEHIVFVFNKEWDKSLARLALTCVVSEVPDTDEKYWWLSQRRLLQHATRQTFFIEEAGIDIDGLYWEFHSLDNLYRNQGKLAEAEMMYLQALEGKEKALGPDHKSILSTVHGLGILYFDQDKLVEAETMYLQALDGYEKTFGANHTSTFNTIINLGSLYFNQGKLAETEIMYLRALEGYEKILGSDHTSTLGTVNNLGPLYFDQDKLAEAEEMYLRALEGYENALGFELTSSCLPALNTMFEFGKFLSQTGRKDIARAMYNRALSGYKTVQGPSPKLSKQVEDRLQVLQVVPAKSNIDQIEFTALEVASSKSLK